MGRGMCVGLSALKNVSKLGPPSSYALSTWKEKGLDDIQHHRPALNFGSHVSWYYAGFSSITNVSDGPLAAHDQNLTSGDDRAAMLFAQACSEIYQDEKHRTEALTPLLQEYFELDVRGRAFSGTIPDMCVTCKSGLPVTLFEVKNELGSGGREPLMQTISEYANVFQDSSAVCFNAPCLLVQLVGTTMFICGAVVTDKILVDQLCCPVSLLITPYNKHNSIRCVRYLRALKDAVHSLVKYYDGIHLAYAKPFNAPKYPTAVSNVEFLDQIKPNLFRGQWGPEKENAVIKIVQTYSVDAHRYCADSRFAPALLDVQMITPQFTAVIMKDCVGAVMLHEFLLTCSEEDRVATRSGCERALSCLHGNGFVHGDFRGHNILVLKESGAIQVLLIDFDWTGPENVALYPACMNHEGIAWPQGVHVGASLRKEHDLVFLERHFQKR